VLTEAYRKLLSGAHRSLQEIAERCSQKPTGNCCAVFTEAYRKLLRGAHRSLQEIANLWLLTGDITKLAGKSS
jgi:hypothetical protein